MESKSSYSPNQIQRAANKHFDKSQVSLFVVCPLRFENLLAQELVAMGLKPELNLGGVTVTCSWGKMMLINYSSRIATKVLMRIGEGYAKSYPELFDKLNRMPLHIYQGFENTYGVSVTCSESRLHHTENIAKTFSSIMTAKVKRALSEEVKPYQGLHYHIRFEKDRFHLSINVSGKPLYMRGYKESGGKATIRENIASGLLTLVGANEADFFFDAFCGSGTFLFEYFLLRRNIAPGFQRNFAFERLPMFDSKSFERIKKNRNKEVNQLPLAILGSDVNQGAVSISRSIARNLLDSENWTILESDFNEILAILPKFKKGCSVSNLPYGKRVSTKIAYANIKSFDKKLKGLGLNRGYLVSEETERLLSKVLCFKNGGLRVKFFYE